MAGTTNYNIPLVQPPDPNTLPHGEAARTSESNYAPADQVNAALQAIDTLLKSHFG